MQRNDVTTRKYKIGKNTYIVIEIDQSSTANSTNGNALASNQADVNVYLKKKRKKDK